MAEVLGPDFDKQNFLRQHWQKQPLLIRQAFPGGVDYLDGDSLAGLASQEGIESRLVIHHGQQNWETQFGPFPDSIWAALPPSHWTLLVQAVDRLLPEISRLRDHFRFLPNWRIDDIMISYAVDQGSVGPHTDNYDVFLIQAVGRRQWQIGAETLVQPTLIEGLELKVLANFTPAQTLILEAGDMLYLPPGFAHYGIALGESITYSIGFRAPEQKEMLLSYLQFFGQTEHGDNFYTDLALTLPREPGLILGAELERLQRLLLDGLADPSLFNRWIGAFLTEPRSFHDSSNHEWTWDEILASLTQGRAVVRAEGARMSYYFAEGKLHFAVEGECLILDSSLTELVATLCREQEFSAEVVLAFTDKIGVQELLVYLWNQAFLRWADENG